MLKRLLVGVALGLGLLILAPRALAQQAAPTPSDNEVNRVAKQLFCPVCENTPLDVCPTEACRQWRETIREKLALGWTDQQIKDYFVEQYGERVLAQPSTHGFNWLVWTLPPLGLVLGALMVWGFMRQMTASRAAAPAAPAGPASGSAADDEYAARLEEELRRRR